jgi:phosphomannomutase
MDTKIFKAYDVRGIYPSEIDESTVEAIGVAYVKEFGTERVVVGCDVRQSSPSLKAALIKGLTQSGATVVDIGMVSTDMMYFAVCHLGTDGGITVSASHNPAEYNGLKIVLRDAYPVSSDSGLLKLRDLVAGGEPSLKPDLTGNVESYNILPPYLGHLKKFTNQANFKPLRVVANGNFGMAGTVVKELLKDTGITLTLLNEEPDGRFPKGRPDPMWAENRAETVELVRAAGADLGVAWDADADRCFFFDERGRFINPYYITAMLADTLLKQNPGGKILTDPRLIWATEAVAKRHSAELIINKAGHTFIKERMRKEGIFFGGESSAHYYFRGNHYADNGMIPFLLVLAALSERGLELSELVAEYQAMSHAIEEFNFNIADGRSIVEQLEAHYANQGAIIDKTDGASINFENWRFNVRTSNTEPLLRLNMEARNSTLLAEKFTEVKNLISTLSTNGGKRGNQSTAQEISRKISESVS